MGETMTLVLNEMRLRMAVYFVNAEWQKRPVLMSDDRLMAAAQYRAGHMAEFDYFDHVSPGGVWANEWVRRFDYSLPESYSSDGNNVESIGKGFTTPEGCLEAMYASDSHRPHVTGNMPFFFGHTYFGVGYQKFGPTTYYVLLTAPPESKPEPEPEPEDEHDVYLPGVYRGRYRLVRIG
jgi:hypothetical protein